ncbi:MAG: hypothetical protein OXI74_14090 [Rhodospirillaceae bacterium]|nr:hypothetical protein [Rhodospirillaceae bacterium]
MSAPAHLKRFPCMLPWEGKEYHEYRIIVVCESHYMPEASTINLEAERWYGATEADLSEPERSYIHTVECVRFRLSPEGRRALPDNAYVRINNVVRFERIVMANYFYRPAMYKSNINSVGITPLDLAVSDKVLRWLVASYSPKLVIVASKTTAGPPASTVLADIGVDYCVVHHPMARQRKFAGQAVQCLRKHGVAK